MHSLIHKTLFTGAFIGAVLWGFIPPTSLKAQTNSPISLAAEAGFGGLCRAGNWLAVHVTLDNSGAAWQGQVQVSQNPHGVNNATYSTPVSLGAPDHKEVTVFLYPEGYLETINASLVTDGKTENSTSVKINCVSPVTRLVGVLSDHPDTFNVIANQSVSSYPTELAQIRIKDIPDNAEALQSLDALIVSDVDSGSLSPAQQAAISSWVSEGGRLVMTGGADWKRTLAGFDSLSPVKIQGTQMVNGLTALAKSAGRSEDLTQDTLVAHGTLLKTGTQALILNGENPLLLERSMGLGKVDFLTFDPALSPFSSWSGQKDFYNFLLNREVNRPVWGWGFQNWNAVRQAGHIPAINDPVNIFTVFGFILLYFLTVGPLTYFLLKKQNKPGLAWIIIPGLVVLFSLAVYGFASTGINKTTTLNRLAVVEVHPEDPQAHLDGIIGVNSSDASPVQIKAGPGLLVHPIPGAANVTDAGGGTPRDFIQQAGGNTVINQAQTDTLASGPLVLEGQVPAPDIHGDLSLQLAGNQAILSGVITNGSDITLEDAVLLTPGGEQKVGTVLPHSNLSVLFPIKSENRRNSMGGFNRSSSQPAVKNNANADSGWMASLIGQASASNPFSLQQRSEILAALAGGHTLEDGRQGQIILAGWSKASPMDIQLTQRTPSNSAYTLYLVELSEKAAPQGDKLELSPVLFDWSVIERQGIGEDSPFLSSWGSGSFSLVFNPQVGLSFQSVESLTLHLLNANKTSPINLEVSLWNFQKQEWTPMLIKTWGDQAIPDPGFYVNPYGEIRMKINHPTSELTSLKEADFSLVIHP